MNTLMIGYDLNAAGQRYEDLIEKLKSLGAWWHHLDSTWLLKTSLTAKQMRDELKQYLDSNDELLVIDVTGQSWASQGFSERANSWLTSNL